MCQICETTKLRERLALHIKNISDGGPISPAAVREVMSDAMADLKRYQFFASAYIAIIRGQAVIEVVDLSEDASDAVCGAVH